MVSSLRCKDCGIFNGCKAGGRYHREFTTYTGTLDGVRVSAFPPESAGQVSSIAIEELSKCGAHTFLRVGTCGGMQENILAEMLKSNVDFNLD